jgi:hypothetical protein
MLAWEMRSYREAVSAPSPIIFDRRIPDVIGYLRLCGLPCRPLRFEPPSSGGMRAESSSPGLAGDLRTGR